MSKPEWFEISRTLHQFDDDQLRKQADIVPEQLSGATLLLVKNGTDPIKQYMYGKQEVLTDVGEMVGFTLTPVPADMDLLPFIDDTTPSIKSIPAYHPFIPWRGTLNSKSKMEKLREDVLEIRRSIESVMPADSYVSIAFRKKGFFEDKRIRNWVADEGNTVEDGNDLVQANALLARITVGARNAREAKRITPSVGRALFPLISAMKTHRSMPAFGLFASSLILLANIIMLTILHDSTPLAVTILPLILTVLSGLRWVLSNSVWTDIMRAPWHRYWLPRTRFARKSDEQTVLGAEKHDKRVAAYPTERSTLIVTPINSLSVLISTARGVAQAQDSHPVPEVLTHEGIYIGDDVETPSRRAYLDPNTLYEAVAIVGKAGSGKSVLVNGLLQWAKNSRTHTNSTVWGKDSRIIDFAMKDDTSVQHLQNYAKHHHLPLGHVTYVADPASPTLDFLGLHDGLPARETASQIARAMQYSFNKGDIMNNSLDVIANAFTIGIAIDRYTQSADADNLIHRIHLLDDQYAGAAHAQKQQSAVGWALTSLAGSDGQVGSAKALGKAVSALAEETHAPDLQDAAKAAEQLYGRASKPLSDQQVLTMVGASKNKIQQLMGCEHIFTMRRARITWTRILDTPGDYHIVLAPHNGHSLPDGMDKILGAWLLYRLGKTVEAHCQNWRDMGKHTILSCDELSMLSNADAQMLAHVREQWRAFGIIPIFATQYPQQLDPELLTSFEGYGTFVCLNVLADSVANEAARRFTLDNGRDGWTSGILKQLPRYTAAVSTGTTSQLQPAFLAKIHNFYQAESEVGV